MITAFLCTIIVAPPMKTTGNFLGLSEFPLDKSEQGNRIYRAGSRGLSFERILNYDL